MSVAADTPRPEIPAAKFWQNFALAACAAPVAVFLPVALLAALAGYSARALFGPHGGGYLVSVVCLVPFVQSACFGMLCARYRVGGRYVGAGAAIFAADLMVSAGPMREGVICLIIAAPLFLTIIAIGLAAGRGAGSLFRSPILRSSFVPLVIAALVYDLGNGPPIYATSVADTMTIAAPPDYVWRYIVSYPENDAPADYWLWRIGLPLPTRSVATAAEVGATRECRFSNDVVLKEQITELVPNKVVTFDVVEQPDDPEILGHLSLDKGQLYLEANADGSTTVIATTWYRVFVAPALYFDWWATDIGRNVHRRVLSQVKRLAEADWRRDHPSR